MNSGESTAGCSSSGRENGAASLDPERPHKKARFLWQIKGKHHLKNKANEPTIRSNVTPEESGTVTAPPAAAKSLKTEPFPRRTIQEVLGPTKCNLMMPANVNYLTGGPTNKPINADPPIPHETVISLAETMLLNSGIGSTPTQDLPGPSKPIHLREAQLKEAHQLKRKEERCIARWQATQTVKGCFDNTINRVLESLMDAPPQPDQRFLAMDITRMLNDNLDSNDDNVENEGILMAINAHGLQSMGRPTVESIEPLPDVSQIRCNFSESSSSSEDSEILAKRETLPWLLDERTNKSSSPANYEPWRPVHEILNTNPTEQFPTAGEDYEYEFMNTAVIQAIKSKGLMTAGTDFG